MNIATYQELLRWAKELGNVFTIRDLQLIARKKSEVGVYRMINALIAEGTLLKIKRGVYATPEASLSAIAHRIYPKAYISTGTVLAKKAIVGSIPAKRLQAVRIGTPRTFKCALGTIEFLSINPKLYFGFVPKEGQLWATPEKAFLDACYYSYKGKRFSFDLSTDVNKDLLSRSTLNKFLTKYDPRFIAYVKEQFLSE